MEHFDPKVHGRMLVNDRKHMKIILWLGGFLVLLGIGTIVISFFEFEGEAAPPWMWMIGVGIVVIGVLVILLHFNIVKRGQKEQGVIDEMASVAKVTQGVITGAATAETPGVFNNTIKGLQIGYKFTDDSGKERKGANVISVEDTAMIFPFLLEQREVIMWSGMLKGKEISIAFDAKRSFPLVKDGE